MTGYLCTGSLYDNDCLVLQQLIKKERSFTTQNKSPRMDISKYLRDHKSILSFSCCGAVLFCSCIQLLIFFPFYLVRCLSDELNRFKMFRLISEFDMTSIIIFSVWQIAVNSISPIRKQSFRFILPNLCSLILSTF